jgi:hypothetical protein
MARWFLLGLLLWACQPVNLKGPVLSEEVFIESLVQLHLAEAAAELQWVDPLYQMDRNILFKQVLKYQNIDTADFQNTLYWYLNQPEKMDAVYEKVGQQLEQLQSTPF